MDKSIFKLLSPKRILLLLIHLTVGLFVLYPMFLRWLLAEVSALNQIPLATLDLVYSALITLSAMALAQPLFSHSWFVFKKDWLGHLVVSVKTFFWMIGTSLLLNLLVASITGVSQSQNQNTIIDLFRSYPNLILFQALIYAPIVEELLFRGLIYNLLALKSKRLGWILSSFSFALIHVFGSISLGQFEDLWFIPTYFVLGYLLNRAYIETKSLHVTILAHFLNNVLGLWAIAQLL